jgi:hypothetical protein
MSKPSDHLSDEQLHQGLASGEFQGREAQTRSRRLRSKTRIGIAR